MNPYKEENLMPVLIAVILGLLQGLTEFLPVSSSGHLLFLQTAFGLDNPLFLSVMLHVATLIAVMFVLRREIWEMIRHPFSKPTLYLVLASVVTAIIYFAGKTVFDTALENPFLLGYCFLVTAALLLVAELFPVRKKHSLEELRWSDAVIMGAMQGVAIFPGISRAGSTLVGGLFSGLERTDAARFSFLMSIPVVLGSLLLEVKDVIEAPHLIADVNWFALVIGMAVAGVVGVLTVKFMLRLISKWSLKIFSVYVGALGLFILLDQWFFHLIAW